MADGRCGAEGRECVCACVSEMLASLLAPGRREGGVEGGGEGGQDEERRFNGKPETGRE